MVAAVSRLGNRALLAALDSSVEDCRSTTARMLVHLGEVDARQLYRGEACSSMFAYCVERLHMSEEEAYRRIHAARAVRKFPQLLAMIAAGELSLTSIKVLSPHLTEENASSLLVDARHASKRELEAMLARRFPGEPKPDRIRRVPQREVVPVVARSRECGSRQADATASLAATEPSLFAPAGALKELPGTQQAEPVKDTEPVERYTISFTATRELRDKLRQAQDLMRHGSSDLATVFERGLDLLLDDIRRKRFGKRKKCPAKAADEPSGCETTVTAPPSTTAPSGCGRKPRSRHVPNEVKRSVVERDGLQCTFVDASGRRCSATGFLELHHQHPFAKGGEHSLENLTVLCATHNQYLAELEADATGTGRCESRAELCDGARPGRSRGPS
jgi:5-methylcytosine-specific restriction endonuclease McrA